MKRETHRIHYAERAVDPYETIIACLLELGRNDEAVEYVERAKSRALLEFLGMRLVNEIALSPDPDAFHQAITLLVEMDELRRGLEKIAPNICKR